MIDFRGFSEVLSHAGIPADDCDEVGDILDGVRFGDEGGMAPDAFVEKISSFLPAEEGVSLDTVPENDPLGPSFAQLFTTLENLSFRACRLTHMEMQPIAAALGPALHLQRLNLWCNRLDDVCAEMIAKALVDNHTVEYLGLGQNRITHDGLQAICHVCGVQVAGDEQVKEIEARRKDQLAKEAEFTKKPPPPIVDAKDQPRYVGKQAHVDVLQDFANGGLPAPEPVEGQDPPEPQPPVKVWFRNTELRCLDLSGNEVSDRATVQAALRWGYRAPRVFLGANPVAASLRASPLPAPHVLPEIAEVEIGWIVDF